MKFSRRNFLFSGGTPYVPPSSNPTPDVIAGANLKLWLKADALVLNDNDAVASWTDSSGNGYNATEATNRPTYKTAILNGKPVVRFDGVNDILSTAASSSTAILTQSAQDVWVVANVRAIPSTDGDNTNAYTNATIWATNDVDNVLAIRQTGPTLQFQVYPTTVTRTIAAGTWYIIHHRRTGGSNYLSINDGAEASVVAANGTLDSYFTFGGSTYAGGRRLQVDIAEVIMCNAYLGVSPDTAMNTYLNAKYAVY